MTADFTIMNMTSVLSTAGTMISNDCNINIPSADYHDRGYGRLASLMSGSPECAAFLRFRALNAKNILYLQAELISLEAELQDIEACNRASSDERRQRFCRSWLALSHAEDLPNEGDKQWKTFLKIREVLKEYNQAIIEAHTLGKIFGPSNRTTKHLKQWIKHPDQGDVQLLDKDGQLWEEKKRRQFISLECREDDDPLFPLVSNFIMYISDYLPGKDKIDPETGAIIHGYQELAKSASGVALCLSTILPLLSIIALSKAQKLSHRITIIAVFTVLFSLCLGLVTSARKVEIFSASAAYAAVQVVFITGDQAVDKVS